MGPVGLEMGPEGPVCQKVGGERTGSRLSFKDTLPMGEEEEGGAIQRRGSGRHTVLGVR